MDRIRDPRFALRNMPNIVQILGIVIPFALPKHETARGEGVGEETRSNGNPVSTFFPLRSSNRDSLLTVETRTRRSR